MARRGFSTANYLQKASATIGAYPFTTSFWFKTPIVPGAGVFYCLWSATIGTGISTYWKFELDGGNSGRLSFKSLVSGTARTAAVTNATVANKWHHACAIATSATDRRVVLDADWASSGVNTTSSAPSGIVNESIGVLQMATPTESFVGGAIAHRAIWNVALNRSEIAALNEGQSPLTIRPHNLVAYNPLSGFDDPELDFRRVHNLTVFGTLAPESGPVVVEGRRARRPIPKSAGVFTLDAAPGSYSVTGAAAGAVAGRAITASPGSHSVTGAAAGVVPARAVAADPESYDVTGVAAGIVAGRAITASPGSYTFTGVSAGPVPGRALLAAAGGYSLSGQPADLVLVSPVAFELLADPAGYTVTGSVAAVVSGRVALASPESYALTGIAASTVSARALLAEPAVYSISGQAASLVGSGDVAETFTLVKSGGGSYLADGHYLAAAGSVEVAYALDAAPGSYALTGTAASVVAGRVFNSDPGSFSLTGTAAGIPRGYVINADPSGFTFTGVAAGVVSGRIVNADPASYTFSGSSADLVSGRVLTADPAAYTFNGVASDLVFATSGFQLLADLASYALSGVAASLVADRKVDTDLGSYSLTGNAAELVAPVVSAVAFRIAGALAANFTTTTLPVVAPTTGVVVDDLFIAVILSKDNQVVTAPANWTKFVELNNTANQRITIAWKRVQAGDAGATFNFTKPTDNNVLFCGVIACFSGCRITGDPLDATAASTSANASSDTVSYATFDPTETLAFVVAAAVYNNDLTTAGAISGTNPTLINNVDLETNLGTDGSIFIYSGPSDGAATGARSHSTTPAADDVNIGVLFGLRQATPAFSANGDPGSYSLTGTAASVVADRSIIAEPSGYTLTGIATELLHGYSINAELGNYALTGTSANLVFGRALLADSGVYSLSGQLADFVLVSPGSFELLAESASYAITGTAASVVADRQISANPGSYALSGVAAGLSVGKILNADLGSYTASGVAAELVSAKSLLAASGVYSLSGQLSDLVFSGVPAEFSLLADAGSYALTGASAGVVSDRVLNANLGSYAETGAATITSLGRWVAANPGSYSETGVSTGAALGRAIIATAASYAVSGQAANLFIPQHYTLSAAPGNYAVFGQADLTSSGEIKPGSSGYAPLLPWPEEIKEEEEEEPLTIYHYECNALPGSFKVKGKPATFRLNMSFDAPDDDFMDALPQASLEERIAALESNRRRQNIRLARAMDEAWLLGQ